MTAKDLGIPQDVKNKDRDLISKQPQEIFGTKLLKLFYFYPANYTTTTWKGDSGGSTDKASAACIEKGTFLY